MIATDLIDTIQQQGWHTLEPAMLAANKAGIPVEESLRVGEGVQVYVRSLQRHGAILFGVCRDEREKFLFAFSAKTQDLAFEGEVASGDPWLLLAPMTNDNALVLHELFPFTRPVSLRERPATFGTGDRLGLATAGHLRAARLFQVAPVLAQQSVRENSFTGRTYVDVVCDASWLVFQEGYEDGYGADGDHLKNFAAIDTALKARMPMITLDLTDVMRPEVARWSTEQIDAAFGELPGETQTRIEASYAGKTFDVGPGVQVEIEPVEARRCALMYGPALDFSKEVNDYLRVKTGGAYDLEISVDETTTPTLPAHHLFIARELRFRDVLVNSLAPRFIGEFEKGIDYIGDVAEFERQFVVHCLIARTNGNYKISVHSGSDKFAVFPVVGRETGGRMHVKTAGTSWLVALHALALHDTDLYRKIHAEAVRTHAEALNHYHISADFAAVRPLDSTPDDRLADYLSDRNSRQMLHIAYGGILANAELRAELYASLHRLEEEHYQLLADHIGKHMELLGLSSTR